MYEKEVHMIFEPTTIFYSHGETDGFVEVDQSTICQCTGLRDKNGKLIWENDLIECISSKKHFITQVEWDDIVAGFIFQDSFNSYVGLDAIGNGGCYSCEVIGSAIDNPELLEVGHE